MCFVTFRFVEPNSLIGRLIKWRLREPWSHVTILFDSIAYSAQIPCVVKLPLTHESVSIPPRTGVDIIVDVSQEEYDKMMNWCETQIGKSYDFASILGWLFGWSWLHSRKNTYCFEFVRECLEHMDWLKPSKSLIKGNMLIKDIESMIASQVVRPKDDSKIEVITVETTG